MFCVRPQTPTICVGQQQQFTAVGVDVENVEWSTSPAGDPATGSGGTFSTKWEESGEKTVTGSCEESSAQSDVTVVAVNKIQYYDPVAGWTDVPSPPSPFFVHKGTTILFRAIKEPVGAKWPPGRPTWGGSSGASGTGETVRVTFNMVSVGGNDYKTVTATCGNTLTVNALVFELLGFFMPDDDFFGRSQTRYGLAEKVGLDFFSSPGGITAPWMGGLQWNACGVGTVTNQDESGTGEYDAGPVPGKVELKLEIQSGPSKGMGPVYEWDIIAPNGGRCVQRANSNIWHCKNTYSIGLNTDFFLEPKDVSFTNLQFKEGGCAAETTGWYYQRPYSRRLGHPEWADWFKIGNGNMNTGCQVQLPFGDIAHGSVFLPPGSDYNYEPGEFIWNIPWLYSHDEGATMSCIFVRIQHRLTVNAAGKATVQKGEEGPHMNNHADDDQPLGGGNPPWVPRPCPNY